ncbi:hypothetical protein ACFE04_012209 [Oxalis oulophora]
MTSSGNETSSKTKTRYVVVTGANKGIGFETVKQLASYQKGFTVILTARNAERGTEATSKLHQLGFFNVVFHQLDVLDPNSVASLVDFIRHNFGRLDILVNNAAVSGVIVDEAGLKALNIDLEEWVAGKVAKQVEGLSSNATIVNVSSLWGELKLSGSVLLSFKADLTDRFPNESIRNGLRNLETLTEDKNDEILKKFLHDFKENAIEANGWSMMLPSYSISKAVLNAYTRILAKRYPDMRINCVHPGYVDTDLNWHTGTMTLEEGAKGPVKCALIEDGGPTGCYFDQTELSEF